MSLNLRVVFHRAMIEWDFVDLAAAELTMQMLKQVVVTLSHDLSPCECASSESSTPPPPPPPSSSRLATTIATTSVSIRRITLSRKQTDELLLRGASHTSITTESAPSAGSTSCGSIAVHPISAVLHAACSFPSTDWVYFRKDGTAVNAIESIRLCDALSCDPSTSGNFSPVTLHAYRVDPGLQLGSVRRAQRLPDSKATTLRFPSTPSVTTSSPSPQVLDSASLSPQRFPGWPHVSSGHISRSLLHTAPTNATPVYYRATLDDDRDETSAPTRPKLSPERVARPANWYNVGSTTVRVLLDV